MHSSSSSSSFSFSTRTHTQNTYNTQKGLLDHAVLSFLVWTLAGTSFTALPQVVATVVFVVGFWRALHTLHTNRSRARLKFRNGGKHQHPGVVVPRTFTVTHTSLLRAGIGTSNNSSPLIGSRANHVPLVLVSVLPLVHSFTAPPFVQL